MVLDIEKKPNRSNINLQQFLNDMRLIQTQLQDPNLDKPAFDVGNSAVTNYLIWICLGEIMMMNNRRGEDG